MADTVSVGDLVSAFITVVESLGFDVGDGAAPPSPSFPYSVVYSIGDFERSGDMADRSSNAVEEIQVTSVGETREQAIALGDRIRQTVTPALLNAEMSGREVAYVDPTHDGGDRDDDVQPPLFYSIDSFLIGTVPS